VRRWIRLIGDRGNVDRGGDVYRGHEGGEGGLGNSQNVWGSYQEQDGQRSGIRPDYAS
jgi:hypothetical protein